VAWLLVAWFRVAWLLVAWFRVFQHLPLRVGQEVGWRLVVPVACWAIARHPAGTSRAWRASVRHRRPSHSGSCRGRCSDACPHSALRGALTVAPPMDGSELRDVLTVAPPMDGSELKGVLTVVPPMDGSESRDVLMAAQPKGGWVRRVDWQKGHWVGSSMGSGWQPRRLRDLLRRRDRPVGRRPRLPLGTGSRLERSESGCIFSLGFLLLTFLRDRLFLLADDGDFRNIGLQFTGDLAIGRLPTDGVGIHVGVNV
jgi:hypothetical protein